MSAVPLVSIIIPCYNREEYIADALDSCLRQTYKNIEIIVVDDGSSDNSINVIKKHDCKVILITQKNQGVSSARNKGILNSKGDFLVFLDSDDWISDDLIEHHLETFAKWPDAAIVCANSKSSDRNGNISIESTCNWPDTPSIPLELFILHPPPFPACEMYKASTVKTVGGFNEKLKAFGDSERRIKTLLHGGKVTRTLGSYAVYRRVENSITNNNINLHKYALKMIKNLQRQFSSDKQLQLLLQHRIRRQRLRYWFTILFYHFSLKPMSMAKFFWHLLKITSVDPKYILFILYEKPWSKSKNDAF